MESNTADEAVNHALSSINRKLGETLSAKYIVNQLVADPMDSVNLSHMYTGGTPPISRGLGGLTRSQRELPTRENVRGDR